MSRPEEESTSKESCFLIGQPEPIRVGKNPGFFKKNPAQWVFLGFFEFFGLLINLFLLIYASALD
jgi:hypothetical protein